MGRWKERKRTALNAALLLFAVLQVLPAALSEGPLLPPADLLLELRELTPGDFSYTVSYLISNIGGSVSRPCSISVWDEHDILTGNGSFVLEHPIQELQPDRSVIVDLEWHIASPSVHRLWAFADPENEVVELTKTNNVVFGTVSLPGPPDLYLSVDGLQEDNRSGTYFSGVPLELKLLSGTEEGPGPTGHRFEMYLDNSTAPLRSWSGGPGGEPSFDVGSLEPGTHRMVIDTSFAGVWLGTRVLDMIVAPLPDWTGSLADREVSFDKELGAYSFRGSMDIPTLELLPEGDDLSAVSPMKLFEQEGEVRINAWVLPDMTTTFEIELSAGMPYAPDGSPLRSSIRSFQDSCSLPGGIVLSSQSDVVVDLSEHIRALPISVGNASGLPFEPSSVRAEGSFALDLTLERSPLGSTRPIGSAVLDLKGSYVSTVFPDTLCGPGGHATIGSDLEWRAVCELGPGGVWSSLGRVDIERNAASSDLTSPIWERSRSYASMSSSRMGPPSAVHVTPWKGNMTALGLWRDGSSLLLREGSGRMAEPSIASLEGGGNIVVWTEPSNGSMASNGNWSDRDLMWLSVDSSMVVRTKATYLFGGPQLDMGPTLASSHDGSRVLLSFVRDQDRDVSTADDRSLMAASFNGTAWTGPVEVPTGGKAPAAAVGLFTAGNVPAVAWVDVLGGSRIIWFSYMDDRLVPGIDAELPVPEGTRALDVAPLMPSGEPLSRAGVLMVRSGSEGEGRFVLSVNALDEGVGPLLQEGKVIASSSDMMENPCGDQLDNGYTAVMWREAGSVNGTLMMAASSMDRDWTSWTHPLGMDPELPMTPSFSFRAVEEGKFWTVMGTMVPGTDNTSIEPMRISLDEMTWACDIDSMKATAAEGYAPGDLATVKVTVVNRGLVPDGTASLHLMRTVRSREDGALMDQHILSEMVQFTALNERKELTFSVTIGDMQAGFRALTGTPPGSLPWTRDETYTSLSAYPDPVVTGLEVDEGLPGGNVTVKVSIVNMGHSRFIDGPLVLMADGPTPPIAFGPGRLEPVGLSGMDGGSIISSYNITLDPMKEVTYLFGFRPGNGTTSIWPEVRECGWLSEVPRSSRPLVLRRLPDPEVALDVDGPFAKPGGPIEVEVTVSNGGTSGPFTARSGDGAMLPDGLRYLGPEHTLMLELENGSRAPLDLFNGPVDVPPPGESLRTVFALEDGLLTPGRYLLRARVGSGYDLMGLRGQSARARAELFVLPGAVLKAGPPKELLLPSRAPGFSVPISNQVPRTSWGTIVVLSNGRPEDGVVLSETLLIDIGPLEGSNAVLSMPLKEGSYLLSVSVMGFPSYARSSSDGMVRTDSLMFEHRVIADEEGPERHGPDPSDVTSSAIIAGGAVFVVLSVGAVFRLQGKDEER